MSASKRLIVNADDLGRTEGINEGIFDAHRRGIVTSATMMVNYPAARRVAVLARDSPGLGIGLHLAFVDVASQLTSALIESRGRATLRGLQRNFGIAYGYGVLGNLRRRPWLALFVPGLLASFLRAARRVEADLLHAHWIPAGVGAPQQPTV